MSQEQNMQLEQILNQCVERHPQLIPLKDHINQAFKLLKSAYIQGNKVLTCGNGGSAADADHMVSELMKNFVHKRELPSQISTNLSDAGIANDLQASLRAISLSSQGPLISAIANDQNPNLIFAQQVLGYGDEQDVLFAISTSGHSENVIQAAKTAKALGLKTIGLTGQFNGPLNEHCDVVIACPGKNAGEVQELHLPIYHCLCYMLELYFFS